jgi:hypothetical protein
MGTRVHVGNLSYHTDETSLRQACAAGGREVVSVSIVTDRMTGQPRGFAFVEFASEKDAQGAITELHGKPLDGRTLAVNEAREREPRGRRRRRWRAAAAAVAAAVAARRRGGGGDGAAGETAATAAAAAIGEGRLLTEIARSGLREPSGSWRLRFFDQHVDHGVLPSGLRGVLDFAGPRNPVNGDGALPRNIGRENEVVIFVSRVMNTTPLAVIGRWRDRTRPATSPRSMTGARALAGMTLFFSFARSAASDDRHR